MHEGKTKISVVNNHGEDTGWVKVIRNKNIFQIETNGLKGKQQILIHEKGSLIKRTMTGIKMEIEL